jgi:hypothetical protein
MALILPPSSSKLTAGVPIQKSPAQADVTSHIALRSDTDSAVSWQPASKMILVRLPQFVKQFGEMVLIEDGRLIDASDEQI